MMQVPSATAVLALCAVLVGAGGCAEDGQAQQGARGACAAVGGTGIGCEVPPLETSEDACWRMVECASIPVENPEDDPDCCFDWGRCVDYLDGLDGYQFDYALSCIGTATCDELKFEGSPTRPRRNDTLLPLCLQFGDE